MITERVSTYPFAEGKSYPMRRIIPSAALFVTLLFPLIIQPVSAQENTTITVAVPAFLADTFDNAIQEPFAVQFPGISLNVVPLDQPDAEQPVEDYLDDMTAYAGNADVIYVSESSLSLEATRAGYLLDLTPLVRSDDDLRVDDFYPAIWNSFQWDGSVWALPVTSDLVSLLYDPVAFDDAGLSYPDESWTLADLENAIRELTVENNDGTVESAALIDLSGFGGYVVPSLTGFGVYDPFFAEPQFRNAGIEDILMQWTDFLDEGLLDITDAGGFDLNAPMIIGPTILLSVPTIDADLSVAPLPGGRYGLNVAAMAVSAGTQNPDLAYDVAEFISKSVEASSVLLGSLPARQSLTGQSVDLVDSIINAFLSGDDDQLPALQDGVTQAFPVADLLFSYQLDSAIADIRGGSSVENALDAQQIAVEDALQIATDRGDNNTFVVATPEPSVALQGNQVAIEFGVQSFAPQLQNQEDWDAAIADFNIDSPDVSVNLKAGTFFNGNTTPDQFAGNFDCFSLQTNAVSSIDISLLTPLDPLVASDPDFDTGDVVGGALQQVQRDGNTWALPLVIQPLALYYDRDTFETAGAQNPSANWTVSDFENVLRTVNSSTDEPVFESRDFIGGNYLLVLMAAYGGQPVSFSTNPLSISFTDDRNIDAMRQVLNLAREGYINYQPLAESLFRAGGNEETEIALYSSILSGIFDFGDDDEETADTSDPYRLTLFPEGSQLIGMSYEIGSAYISAETTEATACYDFISFLMRRPELFNGMPSLNSVINSDILLQRDGADAVDYYNAMSNKLSDSRVVVFPTGLDFTSPAASQSLALLWMYRAWDKYVAEQTDDLEAELDEAQLLAQNYLECVANLDPFDGRENILVYQRKIIGCATSVDPTTESIFPNF